MSNPMTTLAEVLRAIELRRARMLAMAGTREFTTRTRRLRRPRSTSCKTATHSKAIPSGTVVDLGVWNYEQVSWAGQGVPELVRFQPDGQIDSLIVGGDALRLLRAEPDTRYRVRIVLEEVPDV